MELEPDFDNVLYIDEGRKDKIMRQLNLARKSGQVAIFNAERDQLADVIPFPRRYEEPPEPAA